MERNIEATFDEYTFVVQVDITLVGNLPASIINKNIYFSEDMRDK